MSSGVQPLRIQKGTTTTSPKKMSHQSRPLAEVNPMERRRNSPSFMMHGLAHGDSSPFEVSPDNSAAGPTLTRRFWQGRDATSPALYGSENAPRGYRDGSPSPKKRSSIENLKRASRVKNSNMFAREHNQEYDPTSVPHVERPLAGGRPLSTKLHGFGMSQMNLDSQPPDAVSIVGDGDSSTETIKSPTSSAEKSSANVTEISSLNVSPSKDRISPTKSSLSKRHHPEFVKSALGPDDVALSEDESAMERQLPPGRSLHRHAKSVTFDSGPPQINEYEMTTPELSSIGTGSRESSYGSASDGMDHDFQGRAGLIDREDSFDPRLENPDETSVVGPEDWRRMSPTAPHLDSSQDIEDPFGADLGSPGPHTILPRVVDKRPSPSRTASEGSSTDRRPLPPLPGIGRGRSHSNGSLEFSEAAQSYETNPRSLPSMPAPAMVSRSDVADMGDPKMSLDERLRLLMLQEGIGDLSRESFNLDTEDEASHVLIEPHPVASSKTLEQSNGSGPRSRISRESILRKVKVQSQLDDDVDLDFSSPIQSSTPEHPRMGVFDPDMPLPTTESESFYEEAETSIHIKQEMDTEIDLQAIPEINSEQPAKHDEETQLGEESVIHHQIPHERDDESNYSRDSLGNQVVKPQHDDEPKEVELPSSLPALSGETAVAREAHRMSLPEFASLLGSDGLDLGLQSYMSPSSTPVHQELPAPPQELRTFDLQEFDLPRPVTPEGQIQPSSPTAQASMDEKNDSPPTLPIIPEPIATIKAPGGKLKARPSATPADLAAMAAARRQVSGSHSGSAVPPIPERHRDRPSLVPEAANESSRLSITDDNCIGDVSQMSSIQTRRKSLRKSLIKLDVPMDTLSEDLSFHMDQEFDRVLESQKRGYLMRQNTKVIVASSNSGEDGVGAISQPVLNPRGCRSAGNSPTKSSQERPQSWSVEPWNGKARRKSVKENPGGPRRRPVEGPVPPLPGQESNVAPSLGSVPESQPVVEDTAIDGERGRLFVKVLGVKNLDLPLVKGQPSWFNLTLDNGIHCVQTTWLELGKNAPIGQEFELVVLDDLEFTLTLQTEAPQPPAQPTSVESPTKVPKTAKPSAFSRLLASPKKRREQERKQQEEDQRAARQRQQAAQNRKSAAQPSAWDLRHNLVALDGTFARAYLSLKEHESRAYGRPHTLEVDCFNEWATETNTTRSSVKGKRGEAQKRPPYQIGRLELQLLFVPKPRGAQESDMPKSLNACIRELRDAEANDSRQWEGHLSQQGGDCPYWRRRFFKLDGSKLTAYHETTRQPRATINLAKASKLIDDRSGLLQNEVKAKKGGRRKSAFAEEEEGYMFVEEGFRVRFANGEIIDFYADSAVEKEAWMKVLAECVGKDTNGARKTWTDLVLARERVNHSQTQAQKPRAPAVTTRLPPSQLPSADSNQHNHGSIGSSHEARPESSPTRQAPIAPPPPIDKSPRHQHSHSEANSPAKRNRIQNPPRSMIF